ncbi:MAG: ParA family protein [Oscillospiraceae bacterium]|nr:ParA family protein [Oscillospiraceae bacterium]
MGKIIAVVNQKGGVGKTTSCVNLSAALHALGKKTLLCDFDPQANATSGYGVEKDGVNCSYNVVIDGVPASEAVRSTDFGDIIPSHKMLSGAGVELVSQEDREYKLRKALLPLKNQYDFIFIDCPPSLELLTLNGLCAADAVLIPVQCEYYALEGVTDLVGTLKAVKQNFNRLLEVEGVVMTMYTARTRLCEEVEREVRWFFDETVYKTVIPRNIRLSEAPSHGMPAVYYDKNSRGAKAYMELAREFIARQK